MATPLSCPFKHIYKMGGYGLYLDQIRAVPCPDGKTRTVTITGFLPGLGIHRGWVHVGRKRVYGYVTHAKKLDASFILDDLHCNAHLMKGGHIAERKMESLGFASGEGTRLLH